jgi:hypothetical protein
MFRNRRTDCDSIPDLYARVLVLPFQQYTCTYVCSITIATSQIQLRYDQPLQAMVRIDGGIEIVECPHFLSGCYASNGWGLTLPPSLIHLKG